MPFSVDQWEEVKQIKTFDLKNKRKGSQEGKFRKSLKKSLTHTKLEGDPNTNLC